MIAFFMLGGLSVDAANAWRTRAELQATADAAALAGVIELPNGAAAAKAAAVSFAETNMPPAENGDVLKPVDVTVGSWNGTTFSAAGTANAVRAITRRDATNANRLKTYFLRIVGMTSWNVNAVAVAQRYFPDCLTGSAIVAAEIVDFQSNNIIYPDICIHANEHVEVNNGNTWMEGTKVTMQYLDEFTYPWGNDDWEGDPEIVGDGPNEGLEAALGEEYFYPKIVNDIPAILGSFLDPYTSEGTAYWPEYITDYDGDGNPFSVTVIETDDLGVSVEVDVPILESSLIKTITPGDWDITTYEEGHIYFIDCNQPSNTVTLGASATNPLKNVVVIADCNLKVGNEGVVYDAVIGSTAGDSDKIKPWDNIIHLGQDTILGLDDGCDPGGEVKVLSTASINGPAGTQYYGVQMLATQDMHIAAQAEGVEGLSILAGGDIDWASQNTFGPVCTGGINGWQVPYFRLVL